MADADDIQDALVDAAQAPKRSRHDQMELEGHSISDLIKAHEYLKAQEAAATNGLGLRLRQINPVYR